LGFDESKERIAPPDFPKGEVLKIENLDAPDLSGVLLFVKILREKIFGFFY
jgi:hypothetical protein